MMAKPKVGLLVAVTHLSKAGVILSIGTFAVSVAAYPNLAFAG
jgi:hypothetical protein